jgi:hypothetical protein
VKAGRGDVPGTSSVISVNLIGRRTSSGGHRNGSDEPQIRNRLSHSPSGLAQHPADSRLPRADVSILSPETAACRRKSR